MSHNSNRPAVQKHITTALDALKGRLTANNVVDLNLLRLLVSASSAAANKVARKRTGDELADVTKWLASADLRLCDDQLDKRGLAKRTEQPHQTEVPAAKVPEQSDVVTRIRAEMLKLCAEVHERTEAGCSFNLDLWDALIEMAELMALGFADDFAVDAFAEVHKLLVNAQAVLRDVINPESPHYDGILPDDIDGLVCTEEGHGLSEAVMDIAIHQAVKNLSSQA